MEGGVSEIWRNMTEGGGGGSKSSILIWRNMCMAPISKTAEICPLLMKTIQQVAHWGGKFHYLLVKEGAEI